MSALDIEAVQAFLLVAELRSFTRAAEALSTTQSAVSVRLKRLEARLGQRLLERTPRQVRLSQAGASFLAPARELAEAHARALAAFTTERRRLTIGISHHLVGPHLPELIRRVSAAEPGIVLNLHVAASRDVLRQLDADGLDAGLVLRQDTSRHGGTVVMAEPFGWMAAPDFVVRAGEPLPLATQAEPCSVRAFAVGALERAGIPWREAFVGGGVATIGAAIAAGLAVAALGRRVAPAGTVAVGPRLGLPPLPERDGMIHARVADAQARAALRSLCAAIRGTLVGRGGAP